MNPFGLFLISVGLLMMVIGFKGSQHNVMNAFKGIHGGTASSGKSGGSSGSQNSSGNGTTAPGPGRSTLLTA